MHTISNTMQDVMEQFQIIFTMVHFSHIDITASAYHEQRIIVKY